jgi:hypothetical protein
MRLEGIQAGDIVEVDRLGRRFLAFVGGAGAGRLSLQPVDRRISYRSSRARELLRHCAKRGRPRASEEPSEPCSQCAELRAALDDDLDDD